MFYHQYKISYVDKKVAATKYPNVALKKGVKTPTINKCYNHAECALRYMKQTSFQITNIIYH